MKLKVITRSILLWLLSIAFFVNSADVTLSWNKDVGNQGMTNITVGDSVTWSWTESRPHGVLSTSIEHPFESSSVVSTAGYTYTIVFILPGIYTYECAIHSWMKGAIKVETLDNPTAIPTLRPSYSMQPTYTVTPTMFRSESPTHAPTVSVVPTFTGYVATETPTQVPSAVPTSDTGQPSTLPTSSPTNGADLLRREISFPEVLSSKYNRARKWFETLYIREHRHSVGPFSFTTRAFCSETGGCSYPGPTIRYPAPLELSTIVNTFYHDRLWPGDNLTLTVINELGSDWDSFGHHKKKNTTRPSLDANGTVIGTEKIYYPPYNNTMHGPNTTNFFAHGLRVTPQENNPLFAIAPGEQRVYQFEIRTDHAPGVHWYYSAHHGSTALHVMNGLVGAIIMAPEPDLKIRRYPASLKNARFLLLFITKLVMAQEMVDGHVSQGCGVNYTCDAMAQAPKCTGTLMNYRC
jgi:hypothetical protein